MLKRSGVSAMTVAIGRATNTRTSAIAVPSSATASSRPGKTSSPSIRNIPTCESHAIPSWNATIVRLAGNCASPIVRPAM